MKMRNWKSVVGAALLASAAMNVAGARSLHAQASSQIEIDLPAQPLEISLREIAARSGREVIFDTNAVAGIAAPSLRGIFSPREAVEVAIGGTRLVLSEADGAILVRLADAVSASAPGAADGAITITGTRIRGAGGTSTVIVTTRQDLEDAGINDLAGFSRILPQNFTGGQNPGVAGGGQQGGQSNINNSTTLNLRGLGPDATLTLINGHRIAWDALNQGIDISAIPLAAVERVEVIADGASALYGSDAVAGVANIILRRSFDGLQASARLGASTDGGNFQQQLDLVGGADWSSGGFMAALDYSRASPILAGDRDYTADLDPSQSLTLRSRQLSLVIAGHQRIASGLSFEMDGFFSDRRSRKQNAFFADSDAFTDGLVNEPEVRSFAINPGLRLDISGGWTGGLSLGFAQSRTNIASTRYQAGISTPQRLICENRARGIEASAEGPLFEAPGGVARLAVGAGFRTVVLDVNVAQGSGAGLITTRDINASRNIAFAYGELSFPLLGPDLRIPFGHRLILSAALRYEYHEGVDEVATPKLGIIWEPHRDVTLRASWGRSFKVPTLDQLNQIRLGALVPSFFFSPQPEPPLPSDSSVLLLAGGSPDLRPETASTWSATLELRPQFLAGLRASFGWFHVDYRDRVANPVNDLFSALDDPVYRDLVQFSPSPAEVAATLASLPLGFDNLTGEPIDPARVAAILDASLRNSARERARGLDLSLDYDLDLRSGGRLQLVGQASYLKSDRQLSEGQPVIERAGQIFNPPHWRGRAGMIWQSGQTGLSGFVNYVGPTQDERARPFQEVGSFVTLDMSASFTSNARTGWMRGLEIRISAQNLLNQEPDLIRNTDPAAPPYDSTNQSPVGRFLSLALRKRW